MEKENKNGKLGQILFPVAFVALVGIIAYAVFAGDMGTTPEADVAEADIGGDTNTAVQDTSVKVPSGDPYKELMDDDPIKGDIDAPVTIVEFSDFECPFCGRYYSQTYKQLENDYIKTGKVRYVFRDFPLNFHEHALKAAEAGECADEQGKFWEMHDKLFENQNALGVESIKGYAAELGLDTGKFNECLDSGKYESEVLNDLIAGQNYGIGGTPSFIINGQLVVGAQPYDTFKQIIEAELQG